MRKIVLNLHITYKYKAGRIPLAGGFSPFILNKTMPSLLNFIFDKLDFHQCTMKEVESHLKYLEEIITPQMSIPEKINFLNYKVQLNRRLVQLDRLATKQLLQSQRETLLAIHRSNN